MIVNVSPSTVSFEETYNTLIYANRAKNIKTVASRNVLKVENHISNYA
jgi:kinesin family protein 18/19